MWPVVILTGLALGALGSVFYVGLRLSKKSAQLRDAQDYAAAQKSVLWALSKGIDREAKLRDFMERLHGARSAGELNELYEEALRGAAVSDSTGVEVPELHPSDKGPSGV